MTPASNKYSRFEIDTKKSQIADTNILFTARYIRLTKYFRHGEFTQLLYFLFLETHLRPNICVLTSEKENKSKQLIPE